MAWTADFKSPPPYSPGTPVLGYHQQPMGGMMAPQMQHIQPPLQMQSMQQPLHVQQMQQQLQMQHSGMMAPGGIPMPPQQQYHQQQLMQQQMQLQQQLHLMQMQQQQQQGQGQQARPQQQRTSKECAKGHIWKEKYSPVGLTVAVLLYPIGPKIANKTLECRVCGLIR